MRISVKRTVSSSPVDGGFGGDQDVLSLGEGAEVVQRLSDEQGRLGGHGLDQGGPTQLFDLGEVMGVSGLASGTR